MQKKDKKQDSKSIVDSSSTELEEMDYLSR